MKVLDDLLKKITGKSDEPAEPEAPPADGAEAAPKNEHTPEQDALTDVLKHLDDLSENVNGKIMQVDNKIKEFETRYEKNKEMQELRERIEKVEKTLEEFSGVYEMISNQYNPFVKDQKQQPDPKPPPAPTSPPPSQPTPPPISHKQPTPPTHDLPTLPQHPTPIAKDHALLPNPKISVQEERKRRLHENKAAHDKVKHIKEVDVEEKISKQVQRVGNIHVNESLHVEGVDGPKENAQQMEIDTHDPDQVSIAMDKLTGINDTLKKGIIDSILLQKKEEPTLTKRVQDKQRFVAVGHHPLATLGELAMALNSSEALFREHVGPRKDHFADWIEHAVQHPALAGKLRHIKEKEKYILTILYA
ncbi:MAG: hypothetical protein OXR66_05565 [Candidatus Woesearchaeota archaeon]|nr:hypothetical protein [Candidatus Woesearchaeota archaeon]